MLTEQEILDYVIEDWFEGNGYEVIQQSMGSPSKPETTIIRWEDGKYYRITRVIEAWGEPSRFDDEIVEVEKGEEEVVIKRTVWKPVE